MLASTFRYISGIRRQTEAKLWREGIISLDELLENEVKQLGLFGSSPNPKAAQIESFKALINSKDFEALAELLDTEDYYRVALQFPEDTIFLDIETTGLSRFYDKITLVGWRSAAAYGVYIRGGNPGAFLYALERASVVVTYNGTTFDLPFILKEFPNAQLPPVHVDLRYLSKRVGLTGGQKTVEQLIGVSRPKEVSAVDGEYAPVLWAQYRRGSVEAMETLIQYNHADVFGLCAIFDHSVRQLLQGLEVPDSFLQKLPRFAYAVPLRLKTDTVSRTSRNDVISIFPYVTSDHSFVTLRSLYKAIGRVALTIVGIDLTGSEARPSGWCKLFLISG
ncbi:MAG: ribonuclease H-like domain-containing protein [Gammaproteobacteria bacterium]